MRRTEKAELIAVILSALMAAGMITVAMMTHSISILAEGTDTVIDVVASIAVLAGLRLSMRKTRVFPSGLYKLENLIATGIGILILISAYELARESIERLVSGESKLEDPWLVIAVMAVVVVLTGAIAWYKGKVGREENSPSLRADARHSWTDTIASMAIILGIGLEIAGIENMDSIAALVVVGFLAWSGVQVLVGGVRVLLDASIEKEVLAQARSLAEAHPLVRRVLDVEGRNSGSFRFLELSLVPVEYDLRDAGKIGTDVRASICSEIANVDEVLFDFSVEHAEVLLCAIPLEAGGEKVSGSLRGAPSFELLEVDSSTGEVATRDRVESPVAPGAAGPGARAAVFLARRGVQAVLHREPELDAGAFAVLDANDVSILSLDTSDVAEAEQALAGLATTRRNS